ncbi:MAG: UbiH/UbiF/VisC/COQ6 family ubiquinone biosynthesis hydroxylase [Rickettsiella sp.]|nr:UbiH/UbiF/VisC/COQ6 family ubiquinone biosynthesis hydroxylase [Rickettsiella sp.]
MNKQTYDYDVVIVGAGIIGLTLACSLINAGLRIAILDKNNLNLNSIPNKTYELRVSSITLGSQRVFENFQVWQKLAKTSLSSFQCIEVWERASALHLLFDAAEIGQPHLGTIIKNRDLQLELISQVRTASDLDWFSPDSLISVEYNDIACVLTLASQQTITTQLVVGADGAQSSVRELAGILSRKYDYFQQAIVATVQTEKKHDQIARQIFLPRGPLAFLPLTDPYHCSIVWSTTYEEVEKLKTLTDELFCLALATAYEQHLGKIASTSKRLSFPLKAQQSEQYIKSGIALIGDAANTIHPLAGQGANLGIADAVCLANVILEAKRKQRSLGALHTLRRFERSRRFHRRLMGGGIDLIKQTFATKNPFLKNTRQFSLGLLEKTPWLKNYFMQYAMGNPTIESLKSFF